MGVLTTKRSIEHILAQAWACMERLTMGADDGHEADHPHSVEDACRRLSAKLDVTPKLEIS